MPADGGEENLVLSFLFYRSFCLVNDGVYFIPNLGTGGKFSICFLSFTTGRVKTVAQMSGTPGEGLSVSPDGRFVLFSQVETIQEPNTDLMLVENFH